MTRSSRDPHFSVSAINDHSDLLKLSVVIPTLNEEKNIQAAVNSVSQRPGVQEVIVVDGGSSDRTVALARACGAKVIKCKPGRGRQLNAGWRATSRHADWCLFLHADTRLPNGFDQLITDAVAHQQQQQQQQDNQPNPLRTLQECWQQFSHQQQPQQQAVDQPHQCRRRPSTPFKRQSPQPPQQPQQQRQQQIAPPVSWGCFSSIQLDQVPFWQSWLLRVAVQLRTTVIHQPYGDQALFVRKSTLEELNGYKEWKLLEDLDLVQQLNKLSPPAIVNKPVLTSGRLYKAAGFWEVVAVHQRILYEYTVAGASPDSLQKLRAQLLNKQNRRAQSLKS